MIKHKSLSSLAAAAFLCLAVFISPITANADSPDGLTMTVVPSVTTASLGDTISYNYVITSTCNTTVDSLVLTDDKFGTVSLPAASIATGDNISASVTYTVVAGDFPGPISNTATITGISADNATLSATAGSSVTLNQTSSIQVNMSASASSAFVGDNITYTYTITNNGEAALSSLALTDSRLGAVTLSDTTMASGSSLTATKIYTVLSSDLPGPLTSKATATATSATGAAVTATSADVIVTLNQTSSIQVNMSAGASSASVGDNITYTYTITNNGEAALSSLALTDSRLGAVTLSDTTLASGSSLTATKIYTVLSSDLPGPLTSKATATATSATGAAVTATSAEVSVSLATWIDEILTKAGILRSRGVPGKGIDHAPGLQKPFNTNSHMGGSDNSTDNNAAGNGKGNGNGKGKNK